MSEEAILVHPVQHIKRSNKSVIPQVVTLRAYEVYKHVYGEQKALITNHCRGGFSTGEVIAFLYAYSFPKSEWGMRVQEAFRGMNL